jgi:hypothetical protein
MIFTKCFLFFSLNPNYLRKLCGKCRPGLAPALAGGGPLAAQDHLREHFGAPENRCWRANMNNTKDFRIWFWKKNGITILYTKNWFHSPLSNQLFYYLLVTYYASFATRNIRRRKKIPIENFLFNEFFEKCVSNNIHISKTLVYSNHPCVSSSPPSNY